MDEGVEAMTLTWCLRTEVRNEVLQWCGMPLELWNDLAIVHKMAVTTEYYNDVDYVPPKETQR